MIHDPLSTINCFHLWLLSCGARADIINSAPIGSYLEQIIKNPTTATAFPTAGRAFNAARFFLFLNGHAFLL